MKDCRSLEIVLLGAPLEFCIRLSYGSEKSSIRLALGVQVSGLGFEGLGFILRTRKLIATGSLRGRQLAFAIYIYIGLAGFFVMLGLG